MDRKIRVIHPEPVLKALSDFQCGKSKLAIVSSKDFEIPQEDTFPHHKYDKPESFPQCCNYHKDIYDTGLQTFEKFPDCCEGHRKLIGQSWFNKENYKYLPDKLVNTVTDTYYCAIQNFENPNWYKIITDYIEYVKVSYGQFPDGFGSPLGLGHYLDFIKQSISQLEQVPKFKRDQVVKFIDSILDYVPPLNQTSLNDLVGTYQTWLDTFPFELQFFKDIKSNFEKQIPILEGKIEFNSFTGMSSSKVISLDNLLLSLEATTNKLITSINGLVLFEKDQLPDADKLQMELIISNRKLQLQKGYKSSNDHANNYLDILIRWTKDEIDFIKNITPFISALDSKRVETKSDILKAELRKHGFFDLPKVMDLSEKNRAQLLEILSSKDLPYCIAMFDYLGFLEHLESAYYPTKFKLYKEVSRWFNLDKEGRAVKGNISSLLKNSAENKNRYTAFKHKERVKKDYQNLK